jgi:hypothetical protein
MVQLNCYAREKVYPVHAAEFKQMVDSFRYDAGAEFVPRASSQNFWDGVAGRAAIGAVGGAAFGVVMYFVKRRGA